MLKHGAPHCFICLGWLGSHSLREVSSRWSGTSPSQSFQGALHLDEGCVLQPWSRGDVIRRDEEPKVGLVDPIEEILG